MSAAGDREDSSQASARDETRCGRRVPHIGTYRRALAVSVERLYENAIDWEHLPYLHRSTFSRIECVAGGEWGFRARVWQSFRGDGRPFLIELKLERESRRWITRTLEGPGSGTEIWTHAFAVDERHTDIVVDFFVPGVPSESVGRLREFYTDLYARLYDEDVWMMTVRQERLDAIKRGRPAGAPCRRALGPLDDVRERLPLVVEVGGASFRVIEVGDELVAHATVCPHMLGPLERSEACDGIIECPWHGYRFDVRTRACVRGQRCSLAPAPTVSVEPGSSLVTLELPASGPGAR